MKEFNRETLSGLYRRLVSERCSAAVREEIIETIRARGDLAAEIYALQAVDFTQAELDDFRVRLEVALEPNPELDDITDTVQREVASVQLDVVSAEHQRRQLVFAAADSGKFYLPSRADLVGSVMGLTAQLVADPRTAHFAATTEVIVQLVRQAALNSAPGTSLVVQVLRAVDKIPPEEISHKLDPWIRWAVALELLESERGFAGHTISLDPVTRAQASRAKRLLYATNRQDARYDEVDWPLDLTGTEIARLLETHAKAIEVWTREGMPVSDLTLYLNPSRREEVGRPGSHVQIVTEEMARELATRAGAFPLPLVYALPPLERIRLARQIWSHGLPEVPPSLPGLTFYDAGGDPRVRWGAPPHPYGLLCAIILKPQDILHVLHPDHPEDFERFNELTRRAEFMARGFANYATTLRSILRSEGIRAVAHYHPTKRYLHELVVVDPGPETVLVIRESFPAFMRDEPALALPRRARRRPAMTKRG